MKRIPSLQWLPLAVCCMALACAGEPSSPPLPAQYSVNGARGPGGGMAADPFPNLDAIATFTAPAAAANAGDQTALIGVAGGSLRAGDFEIVVPPGAVDRATQFHLIRPGSRGDAMHAVAEFGPHMHFDRPVTIRLPHATTNARAASIAWWNGRRWELIPTTVRNGRLQAEVDHFSYYGTYKGPVVVGY